MSQVWCEGELRLTFRRNVSENLMNMWWDLYSMIEGVSLTDEDDQIIWSFTSHGKYSVQSLYAVINSRGVFPVYIHAIWKIVIPPRVQFFLWLLSQNKLLTRDNLAKRRDVSDLTCLLCSENESITHLFFECCVATNVWKLISEMLEIEVGTDYESVAKYWIANKRHMLSNIVSSAVLWSLWKLRNELCFQGVVWLGMRMVLIRVSRMLRRWLPMYKQEVGVRLEELISKLEESASCPPWIEWNMGRTTSSQWDLLGAQSLVSIDARSNSIQEPKFCNDRLSESLVCPLSSGNDEARL